MKHTNSAASTAPPRPECGRYDLYDPEMWSVHGNTRTGAVTFTEDNYEAARICNTVCRVLASCRLRAITAPPEKKPRGFIQGGLYFDDRGQPHKIPSPKPRKPRPEATSKADYIETIREIDQQLATLGRLGPSPGGARQPLIDQRRKAIQTARKKGKIPVKQLARELGYTTSFIYKQTTEKP